MHPYLTIEVPDETLAEALLRRLHSFTVDKVEVDSHWELRVHLVDRNPENRVTNALHAIDSWLPDAGVDFVRVNLDGSSYLLHAPPEAMSARGT
jgi:hypothetical protein